MSDHGTPVAMGKGMKNATLVGLMMLALGGCARDATVASAPASCVPTEKLEYYTYHASDAEYASAVARCPELKVAVESFVPADAEDEKHCLLVAERAFEAAAGHEMSSLGDAPVPDAAYEDAYASCTEAR